MTYLQSPGIEVKEHDISTYVPGVSSTVAGIGGVFSWGPVEARELVSSEDELALRFGKPTDDNYETFLIASNFLSYADALYVSRAAEANTYNAIGGDGASPIQIKNDSDFEIKKEAISANTVVVGRYPGKLGNSIRVSICTSDDAYQSNVTFPANTTISASYVPSQTSVKYVVVDSEANTTIALASAEDIISQLTIGDNVVINGAAGEQNLIIKNINDATTTVTPGTVEFVVDFSNRYRLSANTSVTSITRRWEYANVVNRKPQTSQYVENRGGTDDELHIIVTDNDGKITGTPGTVLEVWESLSRATDSVAENGTPNYYKDVINQSSRYIFLAGDIAGVVSDISTDVENITTPVWGQVLVGGTDGVSEKTASLSALARAYDQFKSKEYTDVSILIAGRSMGGARGEGLANYIIDNIAEVRRDVVVNISPAMETVVANPFQEEEDLIAFRNSLTSTTYAQLSSAYKYQYDKYNNKYRWVAGCGDDAGTLARTDMDRDPWWSNAGHTRGVYKNIVRLAYNPDQSARDLLYRNDINPVVTMVGAGTLLYGDKTLAGRPTAFDRVNVRRLFIVLEKAIAKASRDLLFEFNDAYTRARFRNMVEPFLRDVMGRRGITRFKVVCDETNNTGIVIDQNRFIGSIFIVPAKSINFITLNFFAVSNTVSFDYVTGLA